VKLKIPRAKTNGGALIETAAYIVLTLGLVLAIQAWIIQPFAIPSESMKPTLDDGQQILVNRFIYHFEDPGIGDIVVFHPPVGADRYEPECGIQQRKGEPCPKPTADESNQAFVKRLVAGPGDTLSVKDGHPVVNGVAKTDEPYTLPCGNIDACNMPRTITIPPNHYFMMGDNRGGSDDSRFWGPVPRDWIIGKAFATYWPPNRMGSL
jgi:signal peptidase I